ncbi:unnamed protein product [Schistosoma margrebowiei]|uniref:Tetraspanin n=1 Tax=Schistosoma margrebowiei TaxID=48269 RepID=A0A3P8CB84_9TREM|nr:unnamed protein product [Schistosoma margrebowiei]
MEFKVFFNCINVALAVPILAFTSASDLINDTVQFRDELGISYRRSITSDYHMDNNFPPNTGFTVFVNEIQRKHKCCGSFDYRDFQDNESFKRQNYKIPASCCKDIRDKECWERPTTQNSYKDTGCFEFLWSAAQPSYRIILYILIGLLLLTFKKQDHYIAIKALRLLFICDDLL